MPATPVIDLNHVSTFARVVEAGSFTAAARALGLPKSSVSRRVSALEESLRVRLLQRGTRKLVLTEAGRPYFERVRAALGGLAEANATVTDMSREIAGPIRFTAGGDNTGVLANLMTEFTARHPKVQIEVVMTPRRVDLVNEGFDLALRAGPLVDSSLVVRRLGRNDLGLFASRAYLDKAGKPQRVSDLGRHRFVLIGERHQREHLRLLGPQGEETVKVQGPIIVHEMPFAADAIAAGAGIGLVPERYWGFAASGGLRSFRNLVRVLPEHRVTGEELSLMSPPIAYEPMRVALLRDFLAERLRPLLQGYAQAADAQRSEGEGRPAEEHPRAPARRRQRRSGAPRVR
jgi:DNA-binding transcriptional LysR family regulator